MTIRTHVGATVLVALFMFAAAGCDSSDPEPTTGSISGTIRLPAGAAGEINNTLVALYETLDEFRNSAPTFEVTANADGSYRFENINPDSYFLAAFKDNDNNGSVSTGDFFGYLGGGPLDPDQATPQRQQVTAGQNVGIDFVIQIVPPGFGLNVTGTYSGTTSDGEAMSLTLTQTGTAVSGTGVITGPGYQLNVTTSGTFNAPTLNLSLTDPQLGSPITLQATVSNGGSTITAMLNGGATGNGDFYTNDTVTLTRP